MSVIGRERTVQPKLDRSDSVLFGRVRPAIQYRSSTDRLVGGVGPVSGYMYASYRGCRPAAAPVAATFLTATQLTDLVYIALWCVSVSLY